MRFVIGSKKGKEDKGYDEEQIEWVVYLMEKGAIREEFYKRVKLLKLDEQAKEELYGKFSACWATGFKCFYCKRRMELHFENELSFSIDHLIPKAKNGKDEISNLEFVCRDCNLLKGDMDAKKYIDNMGRLKSRKKKNEYWKAKKSSKNDEQTREAYKDIFQHINAKQEREK